MPVRILKTSGLLCNMSRDQAAGRRGAMSLPLAEEILTLRQGKFIETWIPDEFQHWAVLVLVGSLIGAAVIRSSLLTHVWHLMVID